MTKMFGLYTFPSISALPFFCFFRFPLLFFTRFSVTHCQSVPQQSVSVSGLLWVLFLWIRLRIIFLFIVFCQRYKKKVSTTCTLVFLFLNLVRIIVRMHLGLFLHYFKKVSDNIELFSQTLLFYIFYTACTLAPSVAMTIAVSWITHLHVLLIFIDYSL